MSSSHSGTAPLLPNPWGALGSARWIRHPIPGLGGSGTGPQNSILLRGVGRRQHYSLGSWCGSGWRWPSGLQSWYVRDSTKPLGPSTSSQGVMLDLQGLTWPIDGLIQLVARLWATPLAHGAKRLRTCILVMHSAGSGPECSVRNAGVGHLQPANYI